MAVQIIRAEWGDPAATTFIGPFETDEQARAWIEADERSFGHTLTSIATLCSPADATAASYCTIPLRRVRKDGCPVAPAERDPGAMHLLTPDRKPIRGTLETIPACGAIKDLHLEADGSIGFDFECWAELWLEDVAPVQQPHPDTGRSGFILVDFAGAEHHEDDLLRCLPGARIAGCPHCADTVLPSGQVTA